MKSIKIISLLVMLFFVAGMQNLNAQKVAQPKPGDKGSWRYLGTTQAKHSADHDVIYVKGPYDYFRRIKFKVTDSPLNLHRLVVRYDDGGAPENIEVRYNIPKGGESRVIDLKGGKRKLKSVEYWYDDQGLFNGKADLSLWGIK